MQETLREELRQADLAASEEDPARYERIITNLPFLDALTSEILRVHPAAPEITRVVSLFSCDCNLYL